MFLWRDTHSIHLRLGFGSDGNLNIECWMLDINELSTKLSAILSVYSSARSALKLGLSLTHSDFKTFAGFVIAPLITWPLTVNKVITNNIIMGITNRSHCKLILKAKVSSH
jgi:hypothetical protein